MLYQERNSFGVDFFECIRYHNFLCPPHLHRHFEMIHVTSGNVTLFSGSGEESMKKDEYAVILPNSIHGFRTADSLIEVCVFSENLVSRFYKETLGMEAKSSVFRCDPAVDAFVRAKLFSATKTVQLHKGEWASEMMYGIKGALYAVAGEYLSHVTLRQGQSGNAELANSIIWYVSSHFREELTLEKMAEHFGYESHYMSRCFHAFFPVNFTRFVNMFRVDAAVVMLQETDLPITEIAMNCGFQSIRTFNREFLKLNGSQPRNIEKNALPSEK